MNTIYGHEKAQEEASARNLLYQYRIDAMKRGPYLEREKSIVHVPSAIYNNTAVAEWRKRGYRWNPQLHEWTRWICPSNSAQEMESIQSAYKSIFHLQGA